MAVRASSDRHSHRDRGCRPTSSGGPPRNHLTEIGGANPLRREGPEITSRRSGGPTHSFGRAPNSPHRDRGCQPTPSGGPRNHLTEIGGADPLCREGPEFTSPRSGGADPLRREGPEINLTEIGVPTHSVGRAPNSPHRVPTHSVGRAPKSHSTPSKSSSPRSGAAGGPFTTGGAFVRSACTCRSMFTRVRASPFSMTTRVIPGRACAAELAVICTLGRDNQLVCASSPVAACPMTVAIGIPPATTSWSRPGHSPSSCGPR